MKSIKVSIYKRFFLSILVLLTASCSQYEEDIIPYDKLKESEGLHVYKGKPYTGMSIGEDKEGWVYIKNFKDGYLHGSEINIHEGFLQANNTHIKNERNGVSYLFRNNGNISSKHTYMNGLPHGLRETYYPNGNIHSRSYAKKGQYDGLSQTFKEYGEIKSNTCYKDDKKVELSNCQH